MTGKSNFKSTANDSDTSAFKFGGNILEGQNKLQVHCKTDDSDHLVQS